MMGKSIFLSHGSPMIAVENNEYTRFLAELGASWTPEFIVIFSAHWESDDLTISYTNETYETIYDFYGFPDELYRVQYPARGSEQASARLEELFTASGIQVQRDTSRGLDHGSWSLLKHMYPQANIPVVQVSVNAYLSAEEQVKIGAALRELQHEDVLIIGSGASVHNLRTLKWGQKTAETWALQFDDWLIDKVESKKMNDLFAYQDLAPHASLAVPRAEHFVPLLIALGSSNPDSKAKVLHRSYDVGTLSYLCFEF